MKELVSLLDSDLNVNTRLDVLKSACLLLSRQARVPVNVDRVGSPGEGCPEGKSRRISGGNPKTLIGVESPPGRDP